MEEDAMVDVWMSHSWLVDAKWRSVSQLWWFVLGACDEHGKEFGGCGGRETKDGWE